MQRGALLRQPLEAVELALERAVLPHAGHHRLVERHAERVDVGARVERPGAAHLLGGHVERRAQGLALRGQLEPGVLELASEFLEHVFRLRDTTLEGQPAILSPAADHGGVAATPIHAGVACCVGTDVRNDVGGVVVCEPVDEVPAPPEGMTSEDSQREPAQKERNDERRVDRGCGERGAESSAAEADAMQLFVPQLDELGLGILDGARVHAFTVDHSYARRIRASPYRSAAFPSSVAPGPPCSEIGRRPRRRSRPSP